jgi:hypothetical protein
LEQIKAQPAESNNQPTHIPAYPFSADGRTETDGADKHEEHAPFHIPSFVTWIRRCWNVHVKAHSGLLGDSWQANLSGFWTLRLD